MAASPPIATPCIQVCTLDDASGLCLGCFRTIEEIARWARLSETERHAVIATLPARRGRIDPAKLTPRFTPL